MFKAPNSFTTDRSKAEVMIVLLGFVDPRLRACYIASCLVSTFKLLLFLLPLLSSLITSPKNKRTGLSSVFIRARSRENVSYAICEQQKCNASSFYIRNFKTLASRCS